MFIHLNVLLLQSGNSSSYGGSMLRIYWLTSKLYVVAAANSSGVSITAR